jgi:DNA mismatch repair protein MutS
MSLIKEYFDLTNRYQTDYGANTILLMQVGSFFEVYGYLDKKTGAISGSNIEAFSKIGDLNIVEKNVCVNSEKDILMAGFKDFQIEKYVKKIQEAGYTAVVFVQDEAAKNTTRSCAGIFSPGTYFSSDSSRLTNNISCIWVDFIENKMLNKGKYVVVGVANIDIYTGKSNIFQFQESYTNNPTDFDALEHFISIYQPSEVILISNLTEDKIQTILSFSNIQCPSIHILSLSKGLLHDDIGTNDSINQFIQKAKNCEKQIYQKEIFQKFYKIKEYEIFSQHFYEHSIASQAFCFLLDFVFQHNPHLVDKLNEPVFENCGDRLLLANHSLKQLNIIEEGENSYKGKYSSVLKMLNICFTAMGKRKFAYLFLTPSSDTVYLKREYDITSHILKDLANYSLKWKPKLLEIKDLSKWERQLFLKKIAPKSLFQMYQNLVIIKEVFSTLNSDSLEVLSYLKFHNENIDCIPGFCNDILSYLERHFDLDLMKDIDSFQGFETNFISKGVNKELDIKTEKIKECEAKLEAIRNYLTSCIEQKEKKTKTSSTNSTSNDYVKIHETEKNTFNLVTTNRRCKLLQDALPEKETTVSLKYLIFGTGSSTFDFKISKKQFDFPKQSAANSFIQDGQIQQLCKTISQIKISMKEEITAIFQQLVYTFGENFQQPFEHIIQFITLIDVIFAKASLAEKYHYCKPVLKELDCDKKKSFVDAKNLRHCLIEYLQTNENYVTNDIRLGLNECTSVNETDKDVNETDKDVNGILLYGTNAVGKTSLIKALGIAVIMAQSGLFVPCSEFIFYPYRSIFTRIIGNDNLFKGLSTFAVEMSELRTILRLANENSLVLGDELCSGTENASAISIFVAGIQRLERAKSSFIFATHLHEIVHYEEIRSLTEKSLKLKHMAVVYDKEKDVLVYDRKLKDGPGNNMYGLEVCKSLNLPADFIEAAYEIRRKYKDTNCSDSDSVLSLSSSHFNAQKIMGLCEKCGLSLGTEVHHLQHQKEADEKGFITGKDGFFHKNKLANLVTLCETCHHEFHKSKKQHKKVKTSKGFILKEIDK